MLIESYKYLKLCEDDSKEILELLPFEDFNFEMENDNLYFDKYNIYSGVDDNTILSANTIIHLLNDI
jgi:hypothetical protein